MYTDDYTISGLTSSIWCYIYMLDYWILVITILMLIEEQFKYVDLRSVFDVVNSTSIAH